MAEGVQFGRGSIVRLALRGIWRVGKGDEVEDVLEELRDLISDYLRQRDTLRQIAPDWTALRPALRKIASTRAESSPMDLTA